MGTQDEQVRSPVVSLSALEFSTHAINCRGAKFLSTHWNAVAEANWRDYQSLFIYKIMSMASLWKVGYQTSQSPEYLFPYKQIPNVRSLDFLYRVNEALRAVLIVQRSNAYGCGYTHRKKEAITPHRLLF